MVKEAAEVGSVVIAWPTAPMYWPQQSPELAIVVAKHEHDRHCVITGMKIEDQATHFLHGAHLFDRGLPRFAFLACLPMNIFPMIARLHTGSDGTFDYVRHYDTKRSPMSPTLNAQPFGDSKISWMIDKIKELHCNQAAGMAKVMRQIEVLDQLRMAAEALADESGIKLHAALQIVAEDLQRAPDDTSGGSDAL